MAMTLRLDPELDLRIQQLADAEHISKQQLIVRAAQEYVTRNQRIARTLANADNVIQRNARLLERLGE